MVGPTSPIRVGIVMAASAAKQAMKKMVSALLAPTTVIATLLIAGAVMGVLGVVEIWGKGPGLLAASGFAIAAAALMSRAGA